MKLWPLWLGLMFTAVFAVLYYGGWVNAAAAFVVALFLAPTVYVLVVILFFNDTRDRPSDRR